MPSMPRTMRASFIATSSPANIFLTVRGPIILDFGCRALLSPPRTPDALALRMPPFHLFGNRLVDDERLSGCVAEECDAGQAAIGITICITMWVKNHASWFDAITLRRRESGRNLQILALIRSGRPHCKTSTPGSNPGGASTIPSVNSLILTLLGPCGSRCAPINEVRGLHRASPRRLSGRHC
jgi:hypothetical protein